MSLLGFNNAFDYMVMQADEDKEKSIPLSNYPCCLSCEYYDVDTCFCADLNKQISNPYEINC